MIHTIIFDLDGTLYNYDIANNAATSALEEYAEKNFNWSKDFFRKAHKKALNTLNFQTGRTAASHNRLIRYYYLCEEHKLDFIHALNLQKIYWNAFYNNMHIFKGVRNILKQIKKEGFKLGLGTNMVALQQYEKLKKLNLINEFDFIVTSEEALFEKPDTGFFDYCSKMADTNPDSCLFIGDSIEHDIIGAINAGMHAILFDKNAKYGKFIKKNNKTVKTFNSYFKLFSLIKDEHLNTSV